MTSLFGTLLHFIYDWTGENPVAAIFSSVDESTFQHMKLLYFPLLAFALVQSRFFKCYQNFWCIKLRGTLLGLALIPLLFYSYNGIIGKSPDWVNIGIFFVSAAATFIAESRLFKKKNHFCKRPRLAFFTICLIGVMFVIFTFFVPNLEIFKDPNS